MSQHRFARFELLEAELQLFDGVSELFGGASEVQTAQSRQLHFELIDFDLAAQKQRTLLEDELLETLDVVG